MTPSFLLSLMRVCFSVATMLISFGVGAWWGQIVEPKTLTVWFVSVGMVWALGALILEWRYNVAIRKRRPFQIHLRSVGKSR